MSLAPTASDKLAKSSKIGEQLSLACEKKTCNTIELEYTKEQSNSNQNANNKFTLYY